MAELSKQSIGKDGLNPTLSSAAAAGDTFANSGKEVLYVENTDASQHTVTIPKQVNTVENNVVGEVDTADISVAVPAGEFRLIAGIAPYVYNKDDGQVDVNTDDETGMKLAVLQPKLL